VPTPAPPEPPRGGFGAWWARWRDRVSILAIGGIAVGGIVCMFLTVLLLVFG
jgi:hypothetical protein